MTPEPVQRFPRVKRPPLTLADHSLTAEIDRLRAALADLSHANAELGEELSGAMLTIRDQAKKLSWAMGQLKKLDDDGDDTPLTKANRTVLDILELWLSLKGPRCQANIDLDSDRASVVRTAIKRGHTHPWLPCPRCDAKRAGKRAPKGSVCTVPEELKQAVRGLFLRPYVVNKQRARFGSPKERLDDVHHALGDEKRIERCRGYWIAANRSPVQLVWEVKEQVQAQVDELRNLAWDMLSRPDVEVPGWLREEIRAVVEARQDNGEAA